MKCEAYFIGLSNPPLTLPDSPSAISNPPSVTQPSRLEHPVRITDHSWPEGTVPVVSVFCWTYNDVKFIRESIDSILMQETTFPVEIIIHDDASTDGTADIIREYGVKHPQLFRNILHAENQMSQRKSVMEPMFTKLRGEFVALSHGDDYWINPRKLELQVALMEKQPALGLCGGRCLVKDETRTDEKPGIVVEPAYRKAVYTVEDLFMGFFLQTSTLLIRAPLPPMPDFIDKVTNPDGIIRFLCTMHGGAGFVWQDLAVYRIHGGGVWSGADLGGRLFAELKTNRLLDGYSGGKYSHLFRQSGIKHASETVNLTSYSGNRSRAMKVALISCVRLFPYGTFAMLALLLGIFSGSCTMALGRWKAGICQAS